MTLKEFWEHVHKTRRRDPEEHEERLIRRLSKLTPDQILQFDHWWSAVARKAYTWPLWRAAYLINGGCSDDGFMDFRDWLILQGREVFEAAVKDPDTLADVVDPGEECEIMCAAGAYAWLVATGREPDDEGYRAWQAAWDAKYPNRARAQLLGRPWRSEKQLRNRLPRLWALYTEGDDEE
jgi:hypothetical protein